MTESHYDARGLVCPLPVLKARKILLSMPGGAMLRVSVTDTHAPKDFELFCAETGNELQSVEKTAEGFDIFVKKTA